MTKIKRWWILGAMVTVAVVGALGTVQLFRGHTSDCSTVRALIEYNKQFQQSVQESADAADPSGSTIERYQEWAAQLRHYADEISDARLADPADRLASLSEELIGIVEEMRADETFATRLDMPPYARDYSRIAEQFQDLLVTLDHECPVA